MNGVRCQDYRAAYLEGNLDGAALSHRSTCGGCRCRALVGWAASRAADPVFWEEPVPTWSGWSRPSPEEPKRRIAQVALAGRRRCGGGRPARCLVAVRQFGAGLAGGAHRCGRHARRAAGRRMGHRGRLAHGRRGGGLGPAASGTVYELWLSADRSSVSAGELPRRRALRDDRGRVPP